MAANGTLSKETVTVSKMLQGIVLGPLLLTVTFFGHASVTQSATLTRYTDITKVIQAAKEPSNANLRQKDLDAIYK